MSINLGFIHLTRKAEKSRWQHEKDLFVVLRNETLGNVQETRKFGFFHFLFLNKGKSLRRKKPVLQKEEILAGKYFSRIFGNEKNGGKRTFESTTILFPLFGAKTFDQIADLSNINVALLLIDSFN